MAYMKKIKVLGEILALFKKSTEIGFVSSSLLQNNFLLFITRNNLHNGHSEYFVTNQAHVRLHSCDMTR